MANSKLFNLEGKKILITGASSGIGRQCAILCSELGAVVALTGRKKDALQSTLEGLAPNRHAFAAIDLADFNSAPGQVSALLDAFGPVNGLVFCAGSSIRKPHRTTRTNDYRCSFDLNSTAAFELARVLQMPGRFIANETSFVFVASVMAMQTEKAKIAYCASKAALVHGSRVMAAELASKGIRVNCVSPGVVETPMYAGLTRKIPLDNVQAIKEKHLLGFGTPLDVANACCFLLSDAARWVTGSNLVVDGGYSVS